jgi:hypothetical protein
MGIDLTGYVEVKDRIAQFKEKYPNGRLTSEIQDTGHPGFVAVKAYVYRTPDDPSPASGLAWEPVPGRTPYTKDSELQNAETSAWGRALIAALVADATQGVASADEVRNRVEGRGDTQESHSLPGLQCPSCAADVLHNLRAHYEDSKQPAFKCVNKQCQGGGKKKTGGNWPWATWDANHFQEKEPDTDEVPIRENYPPGEFEYPPDQEPFV